MNLNYFFRNLLFFLKVSNKYINQPTFMTRHLGIHQSIKNGIHTIQTEMDSLGTTTCAFFLNSPRTFTSSPYSHKSVQLFKAHVTNPEYLLPHGSYLINLVNELPKHIELLKSELAKCQQLNIKMYNVHPGSDTHKIGIDKATSAVANVINSLNDNQVEFPMIVIENMAGDGNKIGHKFEHLRMIIEKVEHKNKIGICLDTCHLFAAGYDIRNADKFNDVMKEFDQIVGIQYLKAMHLNDSKTELGSRKDRHEFLGKGKIGLDAFRFVMKGRWFEDAVLIVETPDEKRGKDEIDMLREFEKY